ncbi:GntR family transcriptional regulator [Escherichia coli]|nr:GntR family transcriptional regulator [Escherichia coli]
MFIDKQSPIPMYHQIMENLKKQIVDGTLAPATLIPSEREYADRFGISRMTVRQALSNLVNEGYLYRQKGKGTFVSRKKFEQPLQGLTSFTEDMRQRGLKASSQLIDFKKVHGSITSTYKLSIISCFFTLTYSAAFSSHP